MGENKKYVHSSKTKKYPGLKSSFVTNNTVKKGSF